MVLSLLTIAISTTTLVSLASARPEGVTYAYWHMAVAFATALVLAILAVRAAQRQAGSNARPNLVSATLARHMGIVWGWGAIALLATYLPAFATWKEWPGFFAVFMTLAIVSTILAWRLESEDAAGPGRVYAFSRYLAIGQLVGMAVVMVGLIIDGKMVRFLEIQGPNWQDWAANNYFFFGAFALALISAYGLRALPAEKKLA